MKQVRDALIGLVLSSLISIFITFFLLIILKEGIEFWDVYIMSFLTVTGIMFAYRGIKSESEDYLFWILLTFLSIFMIVLILYIDYLILNLILNLMY